MEFLQPAVGWWVLGGLAVLAVLRSRLRRRRFAASTTVGWLRAHAYRASIIRRLPAAVVLIAAALIGGGLMRPVLPHAEATVQSRGLDIVMVLDLSYSMQMSMEKEVAREGVLGAVNGDVDSPTFYGRAATVGGAQTLPSTKGQADLPVKGAETRLEATKAAIRTFIRGRRGDRIGLVVFSDNAYVVSPLTFDHDYLMHYINLIDDQLLQHEYRTAIGEGLALANHLLSRQSRSNAGHQVVVIFTDGVNNLGRDPIEVLDEARLANVRVHFVGVALDQALQDKAELRQLLQKIVENGGRNFNATSPADLAAASKTIDSIEKGFLVSRVYVRDAPVYAWFALPALVCLLIATALLSIPYFVDYT